MAVTITYDGTDIGGYVTTVSDGANSTVNGTLNIDWSKVVFDNKTVWATSTGGGDWMAHPMTADEIISGFARELARLRPA